MSKDSLQLIVEWEKSFEYSEGEYVPLEGHPNTLKFVTPYDAQFNTTEQIFSDIRKLSETDLFKKLADDHRIKSIPRAFEKFAQPLGFSSGDFLFGPVIDSSSMLLIGSVIRTAKQTDGHALSVTAQEWTDIAFEQRELNPEGIPTNGSWFERCTGVIDPELQRKTLGRVALAILSSDIFSNRQEVAFRGEIATLQTTS